MHKLVVRDDCSLTVHHRELVVIAVGLMAAVCGCQKYADPVANLDTASEMRAVLNRRVGESEDAGAALAEPQGFADLSGVFRVNGQPPTLAPLTVTSDVAVCAPGGVLPPNESIVLGSNGGLSNVVIYLNTEIPADNPLWEHESYDAAKNAFLAGREAGFDQKECIFLSHVFGMRATQTVQILNSDPVGHNTNISGEGGARNSNAVIGAGETSTYAPGGASRQPFPVSCNIHNWMKAYMIVRNNPYFAITSREGAFTMPKVPAGVKLQFRVWHEKIGFVQDAEVSVNGGGASAQKWSKGRFDLTLTPDAPYQLDVTVNAADLQ